MRSAIALALLAGCSAGATFDCATSGQCRSGATVGTCQPTGFCSFADPACDTGQRYDGTAGGGLASECVTTSDLDSDGDGVRDSDDNCPSLANADQEDSDADGLGDVCDNCPMGVNPEQYDEDHDGRGDVCDNCPHLVNPDQADDDADFVGNVCDPHLAAVDHIVLFLPFNNASEIAAWHQGGTGANFAVQGGQLVQSGTSDLAVLWADNVAPGGTQYVTTHATYGVIDPQFSQRAVMVLSEVDRDATTTDFGVAVGCGEEMDSNNSTKANLAFTYWNGSGYQFDKATDEHPLVAGYAATYLVHPLSTTNVSCTYVDQATTKSYTHDLPGGFPHGMGVGAGVGLATWGTTAKLDYIIVID